MEIFFKSVLGFSKGKIHFFPKVLKNLTSCQKYSRLLFVKLSLSLSLSLSLRDRADTIITLPHCHHHRKLFKDLRVDLNSSVVDHWNLQLMPC